MFGFKDRRRQRIRGTPISAQRLRLIERNVAYCQLLSPAERTELHGHVQVFLAEKKFQGCAGLVISDEIRVTIAAQACILLLGRDTDYYPRLTTILVYPHRYVVHAKERLKGGTIVEGEHVRLGESWYRGPVVLSWDDVRRDIGDVHDGHNVVLHEFAHQFDSESGANEGAPALPRRSMYVAWARVLGQEYRHLLEDIDHHRRTVLDRYGATNPAEFFAVVTEAFFEQPLALRRRHPELYEQMKLFYRQDPVSRLGSAPREDE